MSAAAFRDRGDNRKRINKTRRGLQRDRIELQGSVTKCYWVTLRFYNADKSQAVPDNHRYAGSRIFSCKGILQHPDGQQNKNYRHQWETQVGNSYIHHDRHAPVHRARPWWFSFHSYNFPLACLENFEPITLKAPTTILKKYGDGRAALSTQCVMNIFTSCVRV